MEPRPPFLKIIDPKNLEDYDLQFLIIFKSDFKHELEKIIKMCNWSVHDDYELDIHRGIKKGLPTDFIEVDCERHTVINKVSNIIDFTFSLLGYTDANKYNTVNTLRTAMSEEVQNTDNSNGEIKKLDNEIQATKDDIQDANHELTELEETREVKQKEADTKAANAQKAADAKAKQKLDSEWDKEQKGKTEKVETWVCDHDTQFTATLTAVRNFYEIAQETGFMPQCITCEDTGISFDTIQHADTFEESN